MLVINVKITKLYCLCLAHPHPPQAVPLLPLGEGYFIPNYSNYSICTQKRGSCYIFVSFVHFYTIFTNKFFIFDFTFVNR